jgi:hypothetical protein
LDELVPNFLAAVPLDRFSHEPLIYRAFDDGFELVSVGKNGRTNRDSIPPSSDDICLVVRPFVAEQSPLPSHAIPIRQND